MKPKPILVALVVCLASVTGTLALGATTALAQDGTRTIDASHELATDDAIAEYQESGVVHATNVDGLALNLTIADGHEGANLSGFRSDVGTFIRVDYDETITREIRFYVPSEYFYPFVKQGLEAENADVTADFSPTADHEYTAITVRLDGKTDATFTANAAASGIYQVRSEAKGWIENVSGVELPSLMSGGTQWQPLPDRALAGDNTTAAINAPRDEIMVQYDTDDGPETNWIQVPQCSGDQAICTFERQGTNRTYVLSQTANPPDVRYKRGQSIRAQVRAYVNDIMAVPSDIRETLDDLTGGWL